MWKLWRYKNEYSKYIEWKCKKYKSILLYIFFDEKDSAEQYLNKFINQSSLKKRFKGLYHSLENVAKESIDINVDEFSGASTIKFAYLNGIKIEG